MNFDQAYCIILIGVNEDGWMLLRDPNDDTRPPPETAFLLAEHEDRLRALLDKPVILAIHWEDGDNEALVTVIPAEDPEAMATRDLDEKFERFTLRFPESGAGFGA
jgi:hypothetical protein